VADSKTPSSSAALKDEERNYWSRGRSKGDLDAGRGEDLSEGGSRGSIGMSRSGGRSRPTAKERATQERRGRKRQGERKMQAYLNYFALIDPHPQKLKWQYLEPSHPLPSSLYINS
jgi:hypothetical protein